MQSLIGAVVGLVAATLAVAAISVFVGQWAYLAVLAAGLLAGLSMRGLAGGSGSQYAKGALAAVATGAAAFAGPLVATQWFRAQAIAESDSPVVVVAKPAESDGAEENSGEAVAGIEPAEQITPVFEGSKSPTAFQTPAKTSRANYELIATVFGCLIAYQLGKGADADSPDDEGEEDASPDADPEAVNEPELAEQA